MGPQNTHTEVTDEWKTNTINRKWQKERITAKSHAPTPARSLIRLIINSNESVAAAAVLPPLTPPGTAGPAPARLASRRPPPHQGRAGRRRDAAGTSSAHGKSLDSHTHSRLDAFTPPSLPRRGPNAPDTQLGPGTHPHPRVPGASRGFRAGRRVKK